MIFYSDMKQCEICNKEIPDDYQNLLCDDCYKSVAEENERQKALQEEEKAKTIEVSTKKETPPTEPILSDSSDIKDPNYQENPQMEDKEQYMANFSIFVKNGVFLWKPTRQMYEYIKTYCLDKITQHPQYPKFIWRPKIVDVGCGSGCGSNILSQEADFVWGIDKNKKTIDFAKQCFERIKNNIYYSSQVTFDNFDIMEDTRETMKFDVVVAIEIIEHISDHRKFIKTLINKFDKRKEGYEATEYFISTPNRNNKHIHKDKPFNPYHVKEFTSEEFWNVLSEYFDKIEFFAADGKPTERTTEHTPILAKVSQPKI